MQWLKQWMLGVCLQVLSAQRGKTGKKTQRSSNSLHAADSDAVDLCQFLGGPWLTRQDDACKTSPAHPEPESTWPGAAMLMALLCSTATAPDCFAGEPHRDGRLGPCSLSLEMDKQGRCILQTLGSWLICAMGWQTGHLSK